MNQSKKIEFNKSTLLSLKAELLRKQGEVKDVKHLPKHQIDKFKPTPPVRDKDGKSKKFETTTKDITEVEDQEALRKSRVMLEKKATLYDHLNDGAGTSQLADRYLVDFHNKPQYLQQEDSHTSERYVSQETTEDVDDDDDSGWVEYTDCLGRTRKCHKTDLEFLKKKDEDLKITLNKTENKTTDNLKEPVGQAIDEEDPSTVPKSAAEASDAYKEQLRRKWEEKEQQLLQSDKDVHYQDLLFNEARAHGVGYYAFSESESVRAREQDELRRAHEETKLAQEEAAARRKERARLIEQRVQAARARRRVREGLPPEDEKEKRDKITAQLLDFVDEQRKASEAKATEEIRKLREENEKERQKERENYIREWDVGKDEVQKRERFREMTQEEWVAKQRDVRDKEFAPVGDENFRNQERQMAFDDKGHWVGAGPSNQKRTWAEVRPVQETQPVIDKPSSSFSRGGLYFTSSKKKLDDIKMKYKSSVTDDFVPTLIENEISDDEDVIESKIPRSGVEIAPPPTFEYYGPSSDGKPAAQPGPSKSAVNESIEKGLKYLKDEENKGKQKKEIGFLS